MDIKGTEQKIVGDAAQIDSALRGDAVKAKSIWQRFGLLIAFVLGFVAGVSVRYW